MRGLRSSWRYGSLRIPTRTSARFPGNQSFPHGIFRPSFHVRKILILAKNRFPPLEIIPSSLPLNFDESYRKVHRKKHDSPRAGGRSGIIAFVSEVYSEKLCNLKRKARSDYVFVFSRLEPCSGYRRKIRLCFDSISCGSTICL